MLKSKNLASVREILLNAVIVCLVTTNIFLVQANRVPLLEIKFLDVGQGDSFLISTPDGVDVLVDAGRDGSGKLALNNTLEPLQDLDLFILSHPDGDHVGQAATIVEQHELKQVVSLDYEHANPEYISLIQMIQDGSNSIEQLKPLAGEVYLVGCCVRLKILWPEMRLLESLGLADDPNAASLGMLIEYGSFRFLAAGDIPSEVEELLLEMYDLSGVDLFKLSHHGSKTSSSKEFLEMLSPKRAVIQVGAENTYGHPAPEVLQNLAEVGVEVHRNDEQGELIFRTDGRSIHAE
ncbi:MAG: ComEC/Rec2 family competence protein [Candidatus Dojkabacteria bacterium]